MKKTYLKFKLGESKMKRIYLKFKTGDSAIVISGKDKGKTAAIQSILRKKRTLVLTGLNLVKKHRKATQENTKGEIVEIPAPMDISNVMIYCPSCKKGVRIHIKREETNHKKRRFCHRCSHPFDKK